MKYKIYLFAFFLLVSCNHFSNSDAIRTAENNKASLKAVLKHYSGDVKDSLKFQAAKFLIDNMIYHYGIAGSFSDSANQIFDAIAKLATLQSHL